MSELLHIWFHFSTLKWCVTLRFTLYTKEDIKNNAWVTVNNDFFVTSGVICQWFSQVKISGKSPHEWPKIVIHGNECIILFLTCNFLSWTHCSAHFAIVAKEGLFWLNIVTSSQLICDVTRMRGTGIVTSYSSIVLARANWRKGDLH